MPLTKLPYWRLSGFYFFYFAALGVLVPYWSLYLKWEGFSSSQIGELTAILLTARIIAPNVWAWVADSRGQHMRIVRLACLLGMVGFAGIFISQQYWWVALVLAVFSFFWNAALPQFEVNTLQHLGANSHLYSRIRVWGSMGFIVSVLAMGYLLDLFSPTTIPIALLLSLAGIWLFSLLSPESSNKHTEHGEPILSLLTRKDVLAFLLICFLAQFSHGPYYTFYTIYLTQHGYEAGLIGQLWALGVIAEVVIFLFIHRWLPSYGVRAVLVVSLILTVLRWLLIGLFPEHFAVIIFAQLLHAASYGTFHACAIAWVHQHFTGRNQGRGQALYSSISFGAGGAFGSLASGYLWDHSAELTFVIAALSAAIATVTTWFYLKNPSTTSQLSTSPSK